MAFISTFPELISVSSSVELLCGLAIPAYVAAVHNLQAQQVKPSTFTPHWCFLTLHSGSCLLERAINMKEKLGDSFGTAPGPQSCSTYTGPGPAAVNTVIPSHPSDFISFSASVSTPQISPPHNRQLSALCCRQLHCGAIRLWIAPYVSLLLYLSPASDYISLRPAFSPPLGIVPASPPCCHAELRTLLLSYR